MITTRPVGTTELLDAARTAARSLAAEATATERDRRVTDAAVAAARAAGAFALGDRRSDGGIDADLTTRVRFMGELGRGCPSTAWIVATTYEAKQLLQVGVSDEAYADAVGDVDMVVCSSARPGRATRESGGMRISGRWPYASGCENSDWAMLAVQVTGDGDGPPQPAAVFAATRDLAVDRDRHVAGLSGTGSHTLVGDDVWIPDSHVLDLSRISGALSNIAITVGLFAPLWGAARGALDLVSTVLAGRSSPNPATRRWPTRPEPGGTSPRRPTRSIPPSGACSGSPPSSTPPRPARCSRPLSALGCGWT